VIDIEGNNLLLFQNTSPDTLGHELRIAEELHIEAASPTDPLFDTYINNEDGEKIKWIITISGQLLITPKAVRGVEISHPVMTKGQAVMAAGEAWIAGSQGNYIGLYIDRHSGHYLPDATSLDLSIQKFSEVGIRFEPSTVHDGIG
jgi:hypothetical protein